MLYPNDTLLIKAYIYHKKEINMVKNLIKIAVIVAIGGLIFVGVKKYMHKDVANVKIQENVHWL